VTKASPPFFDHFRENLTDGDTATAQIVRIGLDDQAS
jgi:hypothetical protein